MVDGLTRVLNVLPDAATAATAVVDRLVALSDRALEEERPFALAVSGGRTPEPMFRALAARPDGPRRWPRWRLFWCDERMVPPGDERSNFGLARRLWLDPAHFPAANVHPVEASAMVADAAVRYEATLRRELGAGNGPTFDAVVLGVGPDGHTASLFPGSASLDVRDRWVVCEPRPSQPPLVPRVSLSLEGIGRARVALFLVAGADKRSILSRVLVEERSSGPGASLPAARVTAVESVEWFVDAAATPASSVA